MLRVTGSMDDIFTNAFNLNNMVNMTQMTLSSTVNHNGDIGDIKISGMGIFGANCYKFGYIPQIFNNSNPLPLFNSIQQ